MSKGLQLGTNEHMSNKEYHADREYLSSSNLKMLLKSPEQFYQERILGNKVSEQKAAYDEGSYCHTMILEPHLRDKEFAIFSGWRKQGKDYEAFVEANQGKTILSRPQQHRCESYVRAYERQPIAKKILSGGFAEATVATRILDVPLKARFDYVNIEKGYIADVKTTSYPSDVEAFRRTVKEFSYQLSAALYCQAAHDTYGKLFDFYFVVISKSDEQCEVYKASSATLNEGHAMVNRALVLYKKCKTSGIWALDSKAKDVVESDSYAIQEV